MKKKLLLMLMLCVTLALTFTGCTGKDKETEGARGENSINIGCMKGPTGIGMIKLLSDSESEKTVNDYNYTIAGTADEISTGLIKGELDIAAVPCNLASVLYNKTEGEIVTVAINTLGVLYIVEEGNDIGDVSDLKDMTIYTTGQGTTPEYTLRYMLTAAGIDPDKDVDIQFKAEATEVVAALSLDTEAVAMLPQPYVTVALNSNENYRIALDVTEEWEKIAEDSTVVTGVLVARKSYIEENEAAFGDFMEEYKASTEYANSNVDDTAKLLEKFEIIAKAEVAKKAIPYCNVTYIVGGEMIKKAMPYLSVLYEQNSAAVGGKLEEGMFYIGK